MKGRKKWISETPVDLSRGCTGVQMKSLTFMLASNAEGYSQGQGSRVSHAHTSLHLLGEQYLRAGEGPSLSLQFPTLHLEKQTPKTLMKS